MPTRIIAASQTLDPELARIVAATLVAGGVVSVPTESFYGLAVAWDSEAGVDRLLQLKAERGSKPIPLVLASAAAVLRVATALPPGFETLAREFWPGPLTLLVPARSDLPAGVVAGGTTVGVRVPDHPLARQVARLAGGAATATSANPSGSTPPTTVDQVLAYFADRIDLIIDGGPTPGGAPSTILELTPPRILRHGPVSGAAIAAALGLTGAP